MAERNFVPRSNNGASIGTALKRWLKGWFKDLSVESEITDGSNTTTVANIVEQINKVPNLESVSEGRNLFDEEVDLFNLEGADNYDSRLNKIEPQIQEFIQQQLNSRITELEEMIAEYELLLQLEIDIYNLKGA